MQRPVGDERDSITTVPASVAEGWSTGQMNKCRTIT